ncbi:MAG: ATPase [Betaproteobacteria bacterium]|nr:ATPase [Betaproteobacteria bacterium]
MDEPLQRLLDAEARAQAVIDEAHRERQRMMDEALAAVRDAEQRFEADRAELRAPYLREAQGRADQMVAELSRKYGERQRMLRELAVRHEREAVDAALALLLDPGV